MHPWLIRLTRGLQGQMLDPTFRQPALARQMEVTLWQLEQAWQIMHNPMPEAEADAILKEVFPGYGS